MKVTQPLSLQLASLSLLVTPLSAVDWDGGGTDNNLDNPLNWVGDTLPTGSQIGRFTDTLPPIGDVTLGADFDIAGVRNRRASGVTTLSTGAQTLTVRTGGLGDILSRDGGEFVIKGNIFALRNTGDLDFEATGSSTLTLDRVAATGSSGVGGDATFRFAGDGTLQVLDSSFSKDVFVSSGALLNITDSTIAADLFVESGSSLAIGGTGTSTLTVDGDVVVDGTWIFDALSLTDTDFMDVTGNIVLGAGSTLDLQGSTGGATTTNPIILAEYGGSISGSFTNFTGNGLGPGQSIVYGFGPMGNQIALVPEASQALPILAGLLPLFVLRRRKRR